MKLSIILWLAAAVTVLISIFGSCPLWVPVTFSAVAGLVGSSGN